MENDYQRRIQELESKYRLLGDSLIDAIWVLDAHTLSFEFITPTVAQVSGYSAEEWMGSSLQSRLTPSSWEAAQRILQEERDLFEQGVRHRRSFELELISKDGHTYWIEIISRFLQEADQPLKIVGVSRDITALKSTQARQEELIRQLGKALAEKETLLKENQALRQLLPICSGCHRIRDREGRWWPLDTYMNRVQGVQWTHTICPDCKDVIYSDCTG
jgi:PAS domain S-box-containing protein